MFTGIVEETGLVKRIKPGGNSIRLSVLARVCGQGTTVGDSIAVNGCCLTVVKAVKASGGKLLEFDLLKETWTRTSFHEVSVGAAVNLERSLRFDDRFGGHFVTGHIDGMGRISRWEKVANDWLLEIEAPPSILKYMIFKGAVAIDGISLTVSEVRKRCFCVWIIPHTFEITALRERKVGGNVNLEADLLGKYVDKLLGSMKR